MRVIKKCLSVFLAITIIFTAFSASFSAFASETKTESIENNEEQILEQYFLIFVFLIQPNSENSDLTSSLRYTYVDGTNQVKSIASKTSVGDNTLTVDYGSVSNGQMTDAVYSEWWNKTKRQGTVLFP